MGVGVGGGGCGGWGLRGWQYGERKGAYTRELPATHSNTRGTVTVPEDGCVGGGGGGGGRLLTMFMGYRLLGNWHRAIMVRGAIMA